MAKSRKTKPSFDAPAEPSATPAAPAWVYRSDAAEPKTAKAAASKASASKAAPAARTVDAAAAPTAAASKSAPKAPADAAPKEPAAPAAAAPPPSSDRVKGAQALVERYARYSAAAGLVPVPAVDLAAIAGVQVSMLSALAGHYNVPFSRERGKSLVAALVGGLMPSLAGYQMLKIVGPLAGIIGISGFAMTSTWAVGRVFIAHFEAGGTLLDVNVEQAKQQVASALSRN